VCLIIGYCLCLCVLQWISWSLEPQPEEDLSPAGRGSKFVQYQQFFTKKSHLRHELVWRGKDLKSETPFEEVKSEALSLM
jgi:hypothetical protein